MKHIAILLGPLVALVILAAPVWAADAPSGGRICVDAHVRDDYNARPIGPHDIFIQNAVGDRRGLRLGTTCIDIDRSALVTVQSATHCVGIGDAVSERMLGQPGQRCRISSVAPFIEGSIQPPYR